MARTSNAATAEQPAIQIRATRARQGFLDRDVLVVLLVSTGLAVIALFVALAIQSRTNHLAGAGAQARVASPPSAASTLRP